jgi:hypothetical protein
MAYSDFTLSEVARQLHLTIEEQHNLFTPVAEVAPSEYLQVFLEESLPLALALSTEKARSEMIIAPLLVEVRRRMQRHISLFSGVDFAVDTAQGLTGTCDFLLSRSREQLFVRAPVLIIVEAKNENIKAGLGQCGATMVAAQLFNARENPDLMRVYGAVTTGNLWKFLQLEGTTLYIDSPEYYIEHIAKILGILLTMVGYQPLVAAPAL